MKRSQMWMSTLVVLMLLSFAITTVGADFNPTVKAEGQPPSGDVIRPDPPSSPEVIYPRDEDIFTTTPKYRFTKFPGVTKYRIDIWKGDDYNQTPIFTLKFTPACSDTECWIKPAYTLKKYDLSGEKGEYSWRIRAKVGTDWPVLWSQTTFRVLSSGFNSTFSSDYAKWVPLSGDWSISSAGYLKGNGNGDNQYSIVQKNLVKNGYVYEVRMKRKLENDAETRLFFNANPYPLYMNRWDSGYGFDYFNNGRWRLVQRVGGLQTYPVPETESSAIIPFGWNKLTVWTQDTGIYLWINEVYLGMFPINTFEEGWVGIGMYMNGPYSPLLVDWATLKYSDTPPYTIP